MEIGSIKVDENGEVISIVDKWSFDSYSYATFEQKELCRIAYKIRSGGKVLMTEDVTEDIDIFGVILKDLIYTTELVEYRGKYYSIETDIRRVRIDRGGIKSIKLITKLFFKKKPENQYAKMGLDFTKTAMREEKLSGAKNAFTNNYFEKCVSFFNQYIDYGGEFIKEDIDIYLIAIIKSKDKAILIGKKNPKYINLNNLIKSYLDKDEKHEINSEENNVMKLKKYKPNYILGFGSYKGDKISDVLMKDANYILWCIVNLEHFSVENLILINPVFKHYALFYEAVEHNLIKVLFIKEWQLDE